MFDLSPLLPLSLIRREGRGVWSDQLIAEAAWNGPPQTAIVR